MGNRFNASLFNMTTKKFTWAVCFLGLVCLLPLLPATAQTSSAQTTTAQSAAGLNLQAYPAGVIGQVRYTRLFDRQSLGFHAGSNWTNRRDWGKHDNESGSGYGAGLIWRFYPRPTPTGLFAGIQADLWFMDIDWTRYAGTTGTTEITVFQPTAQVGYTLPQGPWRFEATLSLGAEINVQTSGEPVGEGAIFLAGLGAAYTF